MTKKIPLNSRSGIVGYALVDDEDYEDVSQFSWSLNKGGYAKRAYKERGQVKCELMARRIMKAPRGKFVDHIDRNRINNQKSNLRFATRKQNAQNQRKHSHRGGRLHTSKFKGVSWRTRSGKWLASIHKTRTTVRWLGLFENEEEAARAYDAAASEMYGEFAYLNFPTN